MERQVLRFSMIMLDSAACKGFLFFSAFLRETLGGNDEGGTQCLASKSSWLAARGGASQVEARVLVEVRSIRAMSELALPVLLTFCSNSNYHTISIKCQSSPRRFPHIV